MAIDPQYYRDIILDNYTYPNNKELSDAPGYHSKHMASDSCIDDITVQARFEDGKIADIRFDGKACAISTASTSILSELLKGKTIEEAEEIIKNYNNMVHGRDYDPEILGEAVAFGGVAKQPNRIGCATIGLNAIQDLISEQEGHE